MGPEERDKAYLWDMLDAARAVADQIGAVEHRVVHLDMGQFGGSALTDHVGPSEGSSTYRSAINTALSAYLTSSATSGTATTSGALMPRYSSFSAPSAAACAVPMTIFGGAL